ncbi:Uncharacterised protein [Mycobacteroides abscessus subsp. abscessus]|uniref:hypothetical protein n=1 Tax=Mycobacteroides abscessus TaxID=36809 RepID=UPI00092B8028|nr:hypothetical protein [Mycobacteroides abscessus]SII18904.1 Uncharacterised protein [Mycobacteroides abscessus subsp. abscessus]SII32138.1 Uncharacterised protein [Mycobacteroides abscessus subsp. abscessus]SII63983.1 Uncharacterised protein [Mycobacteroides abscessus subsp. abscessus]
MELAGFLIQVFGALFTAVGLLVAWDRVSNRSMQWRKGVGAFLGGLLARSKQSNRDNVITPQGAVITAAGGTPEVIVEPDSPERQLKRLEEKLEGLRKRVGETEKNVKRIDRAVGEVDGVISAALTKLANDENLIKVSDIRFALIGLGISFIGFVIEHGPLLQRAFCAA